MDVSLCGGALDPGLEIKGNKLTTPGRKVEGSTAATDIHIDGQTYTLEAVTLQRPFGSLKGVYGNALKKEIQIKENSTKDVLLPGSMVGSGDCAILNDTQSTTSGQNRPVWGDGVYVPIRIPKDKEALGPVPRILTSRSCGSLGHPTTSEAKNNESLIKTDTVLPKIQNNPQTLEPVIDRGATRGSSRCSACDAQSSISEPAPSISVVVRTKDDLPGDEEENPPCPDPLKGNVQSEPPLNLCPRHAQSDIAKLANGKHGIFLRQLSLCNLPLFIFKNVKGRGL